MNLAKRKFVLILALSASFCCACAHKQPSPTVLFAEATHIAPAQPQETPEHTPAISPVPTPVSTKTQQPLSNVETDLGGGFTSQPIPAEVLKRMEGKSLPSGADVSIDELRYLKIKHVDFDGNNADGELIVNMSIADDVLSIFKELYENGYKIGKVRLIDEYGAVDEDSMTDNNTSAFCYRTISGTDKLSYHARGLAIDVNPLYNPYVSDKKIEPAAGKAYTDRSLDNSYYIDEDDLCYKLFKEHGFFWGGNWNSVKDYQHFEMRD